MTPAQDKPDIGALPVVPYNQQNYPHEWGTVQCRLCGVFRHRVAEDDPYPCPQAMPTLAADGTIAAWPKVRR